MSDFKKNDPVYLPKLKKYGTILGSSKPGLWDVAIGSLKLQLKAAEINKVAKSPAQPKEFLVEGKKKSDIKFSPDKRAAAEKLDLHGLRVEEAMRRIEDAINRAILAEVDKLEIVHGVGTGAIRTALHAYLSSLSVIEHYRVDDLNPGVTWVYF